MIRYSKTENSIRNIVWGIINKLLVVIWPFIIRSLIIQKLGIEYLGISSLFTSILQMMSLAELGFGSAMVYAMYKPIAEDNISEINALLQFYKSIYRAIGFFIFILGIFLLPILPKLIRGAYPSDTNLYVLYFIYLANTVLSYWLFAYKNALLTAFHRVDITSRITGIINLCMYIAQCIVLLLTKNYYIYAIALPVSTIANNLCVQYATKKMFPDISGYGKVSKETKNRVAKRVIALLGHKLGAIITNSTDNLIISTFLGLEILAIYNNYYQIVTSLIGIFSIVNNSLLAGLGNSIITDSVEKNYTILNGITFGNVWIISWCSICLLCLYQPFIELWVGKDFLFPTGTVMLLAIYFYVWKFKDMLAIYKDAAGMWWDDKWKPIVYCFVNLVVSIILVRSMGVNGVIIGTIVSQLSVAIPWETYIFFKKYLYQDPKLIGKIRAYIGKMVYYTVITLAVAILVNMLCDKIISQNKLLVLSIRGFICIVIPNFIFCIVYRRNDGFIFCHEKLKNYFYQLVRRVKI